MFSTKAALAAVAVMAASPAYAEFQFADEVEPNNTFATAQLIPLTFGDDYDAFTLIRGTLDPSLTGIQDYYAFDFTAAMIPGRSEDRLGISEPFGFSLENNVNGTAPTLTYFKADGSTFSKDVLRTFGRYVVGVSLPTGSTDFGYRIGIFQNTVPEPSTWALMLAGFAMAAYALRRPPRLSYAV